MIDNEYIAEMSLKYAEKRGIKNEIMSDILNDIIIEAEEAKEALLNYYDNEDHGPSGVPQELADILIILFSYCALFDINIERAIVDKMKYNRDRVDKQKLKMHKDGREIIAKFKNLMVVVTRENDIWVDRKGEEVTGIVDYDFL